MKSLMLILLVYSTALSSAESKNNLRLLQQFTQENPSGSFIQQKHIQILSQPFVSKGTYQFNSQTGLLWQTTEPVSSRIKIDAQGVMELQKDGSHKLLTADSAISSLMLALFDQHNQQFTDEFQLSNNEGCITLEPLKSQLKAIIQSVAFCPKAATVSIDILEVSGNRTEIQLLPPISHHPS